MTSEPSFSARFGRLAVDLADRPALTFLDETLTFAELDRFANRMARHLRSLNVVTDDFVTIAEPNSVEFIIALIACWKLGATEWSKKEISSDAIWRCLLKMEEGQGQSGEISNRADQKESHSCSQKKWLSLVKLGCAKLLAGQYYAGGCRKR